MRRRPDGCAAPVGASQPAPGPAPHRLDGLPGVLEHCSPARARTGKGIAQIACPARGGVGYRLTEAEPVNEDVRGHQADRGAVILQRKHAEMPARAVLWIDGEARTLLGPDAYLGARPRRRGDVDVLGSPAADPAITRERQRRLFDPAPQQSVTKIAVKAAQSFDIYRPVVYPGDLGERPVAKRPQREK